ncbi:PQQ-dependent sugar dehydrogenase [Yaniella halotolerans]|uniref:PQQ-dependent sugar dehydrogenase n=1 Tax=Yaniella halotolerans TaxID=225453 RepID=UPI0003B3D785|nr:PQQ-dependent sugar dehydrogenase [Yaniella halotolerans]
MRQKFKINVLLVAGTLILSGCASDPEAESEPTLSDTADMPAVEHPVVDTDLGDVEILAENLDAPWSIAFVGETPLISERDTSRILELDEHGNAREVAVVDQTSSSPGEGGLLGIVVHRNQLYVYQTTGGDNRVLRYDLIGEPGALELGAPEIVFVGIPAAGYHNGGRIAFGPDDMLYITTGDALEPSRAQDLDSLAGKILRITQDGDIPDDNPFEGSPVYSYGHRNPQGLAWTEDETMYSSEFGEDTWDELNIIEAGGNYGWPEYEGTGGGEDYIDPIQQWTPAEASPSAIEIHNDMLYMTALRGQRLWEIPLDNTETSTEYLVNEFGRLREVATAPDGSLWILTNNTDGVGEASEGDDRLLRIEQP